MSSRNEYAVLIKINGRTLTRVIIDQHYRKKHFDVTDEIILKLVSQISGGIFGIEDEDGEFQYFRVEPVYNDKDPYRLILLLCVSDDFLGVINAFRVAR